MKIAQPFRRWIVPAVILALCGGLALSSCDVSGNAQDGQDSAAVRTKLDNRLTGAGSSRAFPMFSKMFREYGYSTHLTIDYRGGGSPEGNLQIGQQAVDFAGTEIPLIPDSGKNGAPLLHIPIASGADVVCYNLPGFRDTLRLTSKLIAGIFLGKIKTWNDPALAAANPGTPLPAIPVVVIHRSDKCGTSFIWTDYLSKISDEWKTKVGSGAAVDWPVGLDAKGTEGISGLIRQTPGSIGYTELDDAVKTKMPVACIENKSGHFIYPGLSTIRAAANIRLSAGIPASLTNTDAPDGYPVSSFIWAVIYKNQQYNNRSRDRAEKLISLLWWTTHGGQVYCKPFHCVPLSLSVLQATESMLRSVDYDGATVLE